MKTDSHLCQWAVSQQSGFLTADDFVQKVILKGAVHVGRETLLSSSILVYTFVFALVLILSE